MKVFFLQPLVGVSEILLGMSRAEVLRTLGEGKSFKKTSSSVHVTDAWYGNGFQVFYGGQEPVVEYIELSSDCGFEAELFGYPVFSTPTQELILHIEKQASYDHNDPELGFSYVFPDLEISLWRPNEDEPTFKTIGIGARRYYAS